jgi:hypothetical protein
MITLLLHLLRLLPFLCGGHRQLALENLALRHQLAVYKRTVTRPRLRRTDRLVWVWLARMWAGWRQPLLTFAERLIGSIRRECLDHVLVLSERHLRRILARYFSYYHAARTHLALQKDAPDGRPIERPEMGMVVQIPEVGCLHHRYVRKRPDLASPAGCRP